MPNPYLSHILVLVVSPMFKCSMISLLKIPVSGPSKLNYRVFGLTKLFLDEEEAEEVEEYEYEEEESEDMNPYSEANCRRRKEENFTKPCNSFDHKSCYSDGKKYSLCQFRLAKCDDPGLVLAIDPQSCETLRGW